MTTVVAVSARRSSACLKVQGPDTAPFLPSQGAWQDQADHILPDRPQRLPAAERGGLLLPTQHGRLLCQPSESSEAVPQLSFHVRAGGGPPWCTRIWLLLCGILGGQRDSECQPWAAGAPLPSVSALPRIQAYCWVDPGSWSPNRNSAGYWMTPHGPKP